MIIFLNSEDIFIHHVIKLLDLILLPCTVELRLEGDLNETAKVHSYVI